MALVFPIMMPSASFADPPHRGAPGGGRPAVRSGGGNFHPGGGGPGPRFGGGGGGYHRGGGNIGAGVAAGVAGAVIGGAIASQGYYGSPGYYAPDPGYYDDQAYDDGGVAVVTGPGDDDSTAYCMQRYRSYDPQSGTYLGNDGYRHPCP
jgi:hypothetical protein